MEKIWREKFTSQQSKNYFGIFPKVKLFNSNPKKKNREKNILEGSFTTFYKSHTPFQNVVFIYCKYPLAEMSVFCCWLRKTRKRIYNCTKWIWQLNEESFSLAGKLRPFSKWISTNGLPIPIGYFFFFFFFFFLIFNFFLLLIKNKKKNFFFFENC